MDNSKRVEIKAFTIEYSKITNVLISEVGVSKAFNPNKGLPHPPIYNTKAIWDTGATNSVINKKVVAELGLAPFSKTNVQGVGGTQTQNVYLINILLPNKVGRAGVRVTEGQLGNDVDMLIGMDIISLGDFSVSNFDNKTTFTFRMPSQKSTNYVKEAKKAQQAVSHKVGRNAPCPCGSGKKYKHCCGKNK